MIGKRTAMALLLAVVLCLMIGALADQAYAQRRGQEEEPVAPKQGPTKVQMGLGIGSVIVAIAVLKFL